jgi:hypothetical protein
LILESDFRKDIVNSKWLINIKLFNSNVKALFIVLV